ncbi:MULTISPECIES: excinuclease ABC subunit C [Halolamina]|uniref:UvrABC system protein C n=1 Tax=Halolamina pelagica TaxID=699431 RepID=A0A1I5TGL7_9EURY|nr:MULTISPECIES: excinuclease ABC subunit C [Halolamina]NHX37326.1 excinuclease ABC subunit C [Halolamina sp. R1-12]SFP81817.1 Excinuclease ABC subunit C [Halolamina pelagica]
MDASEVRERAAGLPREPGVYQFLERDGDADTVLYVGKAVDIRDRVRSYADPRSDRIRKMVGRADAVDTAVTDTETQALLLEANLIKRHQPRYNVRLKDDKSYPLVQLTEHEYPRIEITRDPDDAATVFGPYTRKGEVETVVKAIRETYGLRGCSDHKFRNRDRPCLDHEMGLCSAPCVDAIDAAGYAEDVGSAIRFFEGETGVLADPLRREMERAAQDEEFERAANARDRLEAVESFHGEGGEAVSSPGSRREVDVLAAVVEGGDATVARLHADAGQLVDRSRHRLDAPDGEDRVAGLLSAFLTQYYAERELPDAILLSERPDDADVLDWLEGAGVEVSVPGAGREGKLVELALKNARSGVGGADDPVGALGRALDVPRPERIEGFDVSHAQGKAVVGSDVCFVGGSAEKADYRRKKLADRNDDYANMRDLVRWRAERAVEGRDDRPDPDLLLVDGGEGQLAAARDALAETGWDVPCIALAKSEELVVTPDGVERFDDDAPHLHLLQRVRDEAHRFAVQYHQSVRDEVSTALDEVEGIGPQTRRRLLRRFGSVDAVREAGEAALRDVEGVGPTTAERIARRL